MRSFWASIATKSGISSFISPLYKKRIQKIKSLKRTKRRKILYRSIKQRKIRFWNMSMKRIIFAMMMKKIFSLTKSPMTTTIKA